MNGLKKQMDKLLFKQIQDRHNAYIVAPAGHGKTEMIADIVKMSDDSILVLTHTNAGVEAIKKRLLKKGLVQSKIHVGTIAGFCQKWCFSYPKTACIDPTLSRFDNSDAYYAQLYSGSKRLFSNAWARQILLASYKAIIVDEYQDCILEQHAIFLSLNIDIPVWVFGDPLQGIFEWGNNKIVDWTRLPWDEVKINTFPWRWSKTNLELGKYLQYVRHEIEPILNKHSLNIDLKPNNHFLRIINPSTFKGFDYIKEWSNYRSVLYITDFESSQIEFCKSMRGCFQVDEKQDCNILYANARMIDSSAGCALLRALLDFSCCCASHVKTEFSSYISRLENNSTDFSHIKKHFKIGCALLHALDGNIKMMVDALILISKCSDLNFYRKELFSEMIRSLRYADDHKISVEEAAKHIRSDADLQKRYSNFKFLASRTLLSKGLEFECVIIDMRRNIRAKDFYVAMTRATKMIYVITPSTHLSFIS